MARHIKILHPKPGPANAPKEVPAVAHAEVLPVLRSYRLPLMLVRGTNESRIAARVERFRQVWLASRKERGWLDEPTFGKPVR